MNKNKFSSLVIVGALLAGNALFAQSVDQGKKFYYYHKYKSAKAEFEKVLASNSKNADAIFWLGQTLLDDKRPDSAAAANLYMKALAENPGAPLVLVGAGQIELMQGKTNEARQHFETAISISKGKDINVLNAIGKVNAQTKNGDANYAIEKLNQAMKVKNFNNNAYTYIYLGDAYRKLIDGGQAVSSYTKAMSNYLDMAEPKYKIGMVYRTQGDPSVYLPYFQEAIDTDSTYAPALYEMYYYWFNRDINKAAEYFDKYFANSDRTSSDEYDQISIIYARAKYQEAITAAQQKLAANPNADPRYYRLIAYAYNELKDSVNAKNYLDRYFAKQKPEDFVPKDYTFKGLLTAKLSGEADSISASYAKAVELDTANVNKIDYAMEAAKLLGNAKKFRRQMDWMKKAAELKGDKFSELDYYNFCKAIANAVTASSDTAMIMDLYPLGDSITNAYISAFPDKPQGYSYRVLIAKKADKDSTRGLAIEPIQQQNAFLQKSMPDSIAKKTIYVNDYYLLLYYTSYVKNMPRAEGYKKAIEIADQMMALYPDTASDQNRSVLRIKNQLQNALDKSQRPSSQATRSAAPGSGGTRK